MCVRVSVMKLFSRPCTHAFSEFSSIYLLILLFAPHFSDDVRPLCGKEIAATGKRQVKKIVLIYFYFHWIGKESDRESRYNLIIVLRWSQWIDAAHGVFSGSVQMCYGALFPYFTFSKSTDHHLPAVRKRIVLVKIGIAEQIQLTIIFYNWYRGRSCKEQEAVQTGLSVWC